VTSNLDVVCSTLLGNGADEAWRGTVGSRVIARLESQPALRVNPMLTVSALAHHIAQNVKSALV
jgi:hypothetical protein